MRKTLLDKYCRYFGVQIRTDTIGLGITLDSFEDGYLITIQIIILQILFCKPKKKRKKKPEGG